MSIDYAELHEIDSESGFLDDIEAIDAELVLDELGWPDSLKGHVRETQG